jgi:hypothetical protein
MFDQPLYITLLKRVHDVEKVFSIRYATLGHFFREEAHDLLVSLHHWPDLYDRKFVKERHIYSFYLVKSQESFLVRQNGLQKVLVQHVLWRQVELNCISNNKSVCL